MPLPASFSSAVQEVKLVIGQNKSLEAVPIELEGGKGTRMIKSPCVKQ